MDKQLSAVFGLKKTKFQLEKEARLAKKRKAEAEAAERAQVYAKFVASFDGDEDDQEPRFVSSNGAAAFPAKKPSGFRPPPRKSASAYKPPWDAPAPAPAAKPEPPASKSAGALQNVFGLDDDDEEAEAEAKAKLAAQAKTKGRRIGSFMEKLKKRQETGESQQVAPASHRHGSVDVNCDPTTTNLYVGNLSMSVTEELLTGLFGKYGKLLSVKIMWPRSDQERLRVRNSGFVAFSRREDAEAAMENLIDRDVDGRPLRIEWARAVRGAAPIAATRADVPPALLPASAGRAGDIPPGAKVIRVETPTSDTQRRRIDLTAGFVAKDALAFEALLAEKEANRSEFAFLREPDTLEGVYYRWRVVAYAMGDSTYTYSGQHFQLTPGGAYWVPPPPPTAPPRSTRSRSRSRSPSPARTSRARSTLSTEARAEFQGMVDTLGLSRRPITLAMAFALDHAEAARDVASIITTGLLAPNAPAPRLVARLYLLSDVLHNSSAVVKNASAYRGLLQAALPDVFEVLHTTLRSITGRMTAGALQEKVLAVVRNWNAVTMFSVAFTAGLEATFLRTAAMEVEARAAVTPDEVGVPVEELQRTCKHSGVPSTGTAQDMAARLRWAGTYIHQKAVAVSLGGGNADALMKVAQAALPASAFATQEVPEAPPAPAQAPVAKAATGSGFVTVTAEEEEATRVQRQAAVAAELAKRQAAEQDAVQVVSGGDPATPVEEPSDDEEDIDGVSLSGSDFDELDDEFVL